MSILTRLTATVIAGVDKTVSQVENHDAIIDASIKDSRKTLARARVRLQHVQRDGANIKKNIRENEQQIKTWADRAKNSHSENRELALTCMQRRKNCQTELQRNQAALLQHESVESQVNTTITGLERKIREITEQRNQLRTRQSAAEAQRLINHLDCNGAAGIDDTFDRWNSMVSEAEIMQGSFVNEPVEDSLEATFNSQEEEAELQAELDALMINSSKNQE